MRRISVSLFLLFVTAPAQADFVLMPPAPATAPPSHHPKLHPVWLRPRRPPAPAVSGFGSHIPLSFAVRQIVPAPFQVSFAAGADRNAAVDWKGGKPWRDTLADAIRPLGLELSVKGEAVTIASRPGR